jgi:predicted transcriptional regulator
VNEVESGVQNVLIGLTADIVSAHVSNNAVSVNQVSTVIGNVFGALAGLGTPVVQPEARPEPSVSVRSSVKQDYIVCLEDGKKLKMLKRHLMTRYNLTPDQYRARWNLPLDYPMVAPSYSEKRRSLAVTIGLGRKAVPAPVAKAAGKAATIPKAARKPSVKKAASEPAQDTTPVLATELA